MQRRDPDAALHYLEQSYLASPETSPFSPLTRGVAVELVRSARGAAKGAAAALAERMGILPTV